MIETIIKYRIRMQRYCVILYTFHSLFGISQSAAQSLVFSQYYFSPPNINPSLASLEKDLFLGVNYRSQWRDLTVPYNATLFSVICPVFATKPTLRHLGGFGLSLSKETAGINSLYQSLRGHFSAAYNLPLDYQSSNLLAMGIQGGFVQKSLNEMALQWGSQYNPVIGFDPALIPSLGELHNRIIYPTFSAGITWYHVG
jgi:type IX secretion system PorP/SprF family membrane protein